ncbi:MAG: ABC transporter permease [Lachnospiraceae bacterium]|nr:ABC transporter permease [Lachnospiraceae bacterium]
MRVVLKIVKKALPSVSMYFIIFFGMTIAMSFLTGKDQEKMYQATELTIYVEDKDTSVLSNALTEYLAKENEVETEYDKELLSELLFSGLVDYVVYFEEGFEENFLSGKKGGIERQSTKPNMAFVDQKIELFFQYVRGELAMGKTLEDACASVLKNTENRAETEVLSGRQAMSTRPGYFFFTFLAYILPCILIMVLGPVMYSFYRKDIKMRTDCGKVTVRKQNIEVVKGIALVAVALWALFMGLGAIIYHRDFTPAEYLLGTLNSLVMLLFSVAISVLLGVLLPNVEALNGASNILGLGMSFLCGVFVPAYLLPDYVNKIGEFLPAGWYMKNVILLNEENAATEHFTEFLMNCGVVTAFAVAVFFVFLVVVKRKKVA